MLSTSPFIDKLPNLYEKGYEEKQYRIIREKLREYASLLYGKPAMRQYDTPFYLVGNVDAGGSLDALLWTPFRIYILEFKNYPTGKLKIGDEWKLYPNPNDEPLTVMGGAYDNPKQQATKNASKLNKSLKIKFKDNWTNLKDGIGIFIIFNNENITIQDSECCLITEEWQLIVTDNNHFIERLHNDIKERNKKFEERHDWRKFYRYENAKAFIEEFLVVEKDRLVHDGDSLNIAKQLYEQGNYNMCIIHLDYKGADSNPVVLKYRLMCYWHLRRNDKSRFDFNVAKYKEKSSQEVQSYGYLLAGIAYYKNFWEYDYNNAINCLIEAWNRNTSLTTEDLLAGKTWKIDELIYHIHKEEEKKKRKEEYAQKYYTLIKEGREAHEISAEILFTMVSIVVFVFTLGDFLYFNYEYFRNLSAILFIIAITFGNRAFGQWRNYFPVWCKKYYYSEQMSFFLTKTGWKGVYDFEDLCKNVWNNKYNILRIVLQCLILAITIYIGFYIINHIIDYILQLSILNKLVVWIEHHITLPITDVWKNLYWTLAGGQLLAFLITSVRLVFFDKNHCRFLRNYGDQEPSFSQYNLKSPRFNVPNEYLVCMTKYENFQKVALSFVKNACKVSLLLTMFIVVAITITQIIIYYFG